MPKSHEVRRRWCQCVSTAILFAGGAGLVYADPPPLVQSSTLQNDAQRIQRYYQQPAPGSQSAPVDPLKQADTAPTNSHGPTSASGSHFLLRQVVFSHSALLPQAELDAAARPFVGQQMG